MSVGGEARPDPTPRNMRRFVANLEAAGLLRAEYPDQMAAASCTCEPEAICGAHRLLLRYDQLYTHLRELNADRRTLRAEIDRLRALSVAPEAPPMSADLTELRRLAEAATPGPWWWGGHKNRNAGGPVLTTSMPGYGWVTVMDSARCGMRGAQPRFRNEHMVMVDSIDLAVQQVSYRDDIKEIDHPDARYIAAADPSTVLALLDEIDRLRALSVAPPTTPPAGEVARRREAAGLLPACDSCGTTGAEDNELIRCEEDGTVYHYCEECYQP